MVRNSQSSNGCESRARQMQINNTERSVDYMPELSLAVVRSVCTLHLNEWTLGGQTQFSHSCESWQNILCAMFPSILTSHAVPIDGAPISFESDR